MVEVTVKQLADVVGVPVEKLLKQVQGAGLRHTTAEAVISDEEKQKLLDFLRISHGADGDAKITLKRKSVSTIKIANPQGKSKTVNVEVRKQRIYVKKPSDEKLNEIEPDKRDDSQELSIAEDAISLGDIREADSSLQSSSGAVVAQEVEVVGQKGEFKATAVDVQSELKASELKATESAAFSKDAAKKSTKDLKDESHSDKSAKFKQVKSNISVEKTAKKSESASASKEADAPAKVLSPEEKAQKQAIEQRRKEAEEKARQETLERAKRVAEELERRKTDVQSSSEEEEEQDQLVKLAFEESLKAEERVSKRTRKVPDRKSKYGSNSSAMNAPYSKATKKTQDHGFTQPSEPIVREVRLLGEAIIVADLAGQMSVKSSEVIKRLMNLGVMATLNQAIDLDTAILVVEEMGHKYILAKENEAEARLEQNLEDVQSRVDLQARPPVVTIMGHVDHGKTSLLDYIRRTKVAAGEAGGITQHIGAYHVETERGVITFLDTPGHAAFTAMRARGAKVTDIVILVVAADDGVMPQTEEAIDHARAAGVPIIVAINKVDKPGSDSERVKNELATRKNLLPEEWGGEVQYVNVSAHTGQGVDDLLESVLLQAEILELKAPFEGLASGVIIESKLDKGRGPVSSALVQKGRLKHGDIVLVGTFFGKVRAMHNEHGRILDVATPSIPVEILGLPGVPDAGDEFMVVADERKAREVADFRKDRQRQQRFSRQRVVSLEGFFENVKDQDVKSMNIILKTDVRGSLEALTASLSDIGNKEVRVNIVGSGVGAVVESDVNLALTAKAVVIAFNVRADAQARKISQEESLDIRYYSIIYDVIDDVKSALVGMLDPELKETILGIAEVREVFRSSKFGLVAGCMVQEGSLFRNKRIRVLRDNVVVFEGELESLRRFKDDASEVKQGMECGVAVRGYNDVREKDKIESYDVKKITRVL